jgi:hypothetical protein
MPEGVPKALREHIAAEAGDRCGYCLTDRRVSGAQMHIEHPIPRAQGGRSARTNLWLINQVASAVRGPHNENFGAPTAWRLANHCALRQCYRISQRISQHGLGHDYGNPGAHVL